MNARMLILSFLFFTYAGLANADKVAVIGGGSAGLISAWLIEETHEVTLYEAKSRLGGHIDTIEIALDGQKVSYEGGAEFFNEVAYPHFMKLLRHFNLPLHSFTLVTHFYHTEKDDHIILPPFYNTTFEWYALRPANLIRFMYLDKVLEKARTLMKQHNTQILYQDFFNSINLSASFKEKFMIPFNSASWGVSPEVMKDTVAWDVLKIMYDANKLANYQWYEVEGGLKKYIDAVAADLKNTRILLNTAVKSIHSENGKLRIKDSQGNAALYDHIVLAAPPAVVAALLQEVPVMRDIQQALSEVHSFTTTIAIHGDTRFMPENPNTWRVLNIRYDGKKAAISMYKPWLAKKPVFKSWLTFDVRSSEDEGGAVPSPLYALRHYQHLLPDRYYFIAQSMVEKAQGYQNIWFAGMWTQENDVHESSVLSAIRVAQNLAPDSRRLQSIF